MSSAGLEIEIKLRVAGAAEARRKLRRLGARSLGRVHERNTLFDTEENRLGRSGRLLRVRSMENAGRGRAVRDGFGRRGSNSQLPGLLTFKGPGEGGCYKVRKEIEVEIASPEAAERILEELGFVGWFRYEKYRSSFRLPGLPRLLVELDETPIGVFFELEGPRDAIDRGAKQLGYHPEDYVTASYYELFEAKRARMGLEPGAMLFPAKS